MSRLIRLLRCPAPGRWLRAIALIAVLLPGFLPPAAAAQPAVVATVKPLQLIVGAIGHGVVETSLLIPSTESYHHFTLRPSSMRELTGADLVVWVGPGLETYLSDVIWQLPQRVTVINASELPGIRRHPVVDDALIGETGHEALDDHDMDPHLWLDTGNARLIAAAVADQLASLDPANAGRYAQNLADFETALTAADEATARRLDALPDRPYAVYHNAFQYFEKQHGLEPALIFVQSDEIQPGIRQLLSVRRALERIDPACLLVDVTANTDTIRTVLGGRSLRRISADPLGGGLDAGDGGYVALIDGLTAAFAQCLMR